MTDFPTAGEPQPAPVSTFEPEAGMDGSRAGSTDGPSRRCPVCGTDNPADSSFCEACGADLVVTARAATAPADGAAAASDGPVMASSATPQTAPAGEESPLDVGWTGPVPSAPEAPIDDELVCHACGQGRIVDGYCDNCGTPPPDPRDHFTESPAAWVGGVCDIGRRHSRNEDAMSLSATEAPGSRAVLVVCDGVSMASDSHIASLAAAKEARAVLDQPFPRGAGTPDAWAAAARRALTTAVTRANEAVVAAVVEDVPNPPSCTFASAVVEDDVIVAGNVGDSRVYWLPDAAHEPALQLGRDDSFAQEQMSAGVPRLEAEHGPHAHSITRWLGRDAPDDLTPHLTTVTASAGWLMVCSDGLWNYCSEAEDLRTLLHGLAAGTDDPTPAAIAQALVDFANEQGGRDNITVALARLAGRGSTTTSEPAETTAPVEGDPSHG
ncbi:protein phosphatase 2C domain-containing protein [Terrabacter lapilli]|uniref:Protein phosphatase 2C domain-containing protein n=1 Tax=Terrabacter lapilli TaxID=436231 RepID=A0ABP5E6G6_9MICO|nr:PP2C family serine/threonine-protein phosphatase [Terrabacter sp.]